MTVLKNPVLFLIPLLALFFSCAARIDGVVKKGGAAEITLKTSLEPRTIGLIRSIRGFMGDAAAAPILDGPAMSRSMSAAPGIRAVSLRNTGPSALEGSITISRLEDFLVSGAAKEKFITFTENPASSSIVITIDKNNAPEIISSLSPEVEEYLSALLAPAVLGEDSSRQEYLDLVTAVYGRAQAAEIAAARIQAVIEFPGPVATVLGGKASGRQAEFDIPLTDLLVLEHPLRYEVYWR
jgi:hypothetical protein